MSYRMVLERNLLSQADVTIIRGIPVITESEQVDENDIMVISTTVEKEKPSQMECVTEIEDDWLRAEIATLVDNYKPAKVESSVIRMEILMSDNIPVYQHPRRLSEMERTVVQEMVDGFIREGIVRPSKSPYASPVLLRKKKNGTWRFCVDYRKLNEKIIKDRNHVMS